MRVACAKRKFRRARFAMAPRKTSLTREKSASGVLSVALQAPITPPHHHSHRSSLAQVQAFSAFFRGLPAADLDTLYERMLMVDFAEDEVLARRGETVSWVGVLIAGELESDPSGEFGEIDHEAASPPGDEEPDADENEGEGEGAGESEEGEEDSDDNHAGLDVGAPLELLPVGTIIGSLALFRNGASRHAASIRGAAGGGTIALLTTASVPQFFSSSPIAATRLLAIFGRAAVSKTVPPQLPPRIDRAARRRESVAAAAAPGHRRALIAGGWRCCGGLKVLPRR